MRSQTPSWRARLLALAAAVPLLLPAAAAADGTAVWRDCVQGGLDQRHSQADYEDALSNIPADANEYSDCVDQIRRAQRAASQTPPGVVSGKTPTVQTPTSGGPTATRNSVSADALGQALRKSGVDTAAPAAPGETPPAPEPVTVAGQTIDLAAGRVPSIGNALSLPLPLALSAATIFLFGLGPVLRRAAAWRAARAGDSGGDA